MAFFCSLKFELDIFCSANSYGDDCSVFCYRLETLDHYVCDSDERTQHLRGKIDALKYAVIL